MASAKPIKAFRIVLSEADELEARRQAESLLRDIKNYGDDNDKLKVTHIGTILKMFAESIVVEDHGD